MEPTLVEAHHPVTPERVRAVMTALRPHDDDALAELATLYHEDLVFSDPIVSLRGRDAFIAANRRLIQRSRVLEFEVHDIGLIANEAGGKIVAEWVMRFAVSKLPEMTVPGMSSLQLLDGRIHGHRDYWDTLSAGASMFPMLLRAYRGLTSRLA